ncbi:MAG TPA: type VI secretion system baseplate subunit TssK [Limnobacter sp.]|nr:type VI secretion system baseplate subunit TssK [Limnobacter sp.]
MTKNNRVIWNEGLFLQPQHFQQQERYLEHEIQVRTASFNAWSHGFNELVLDQDLLACGKVAVLKASGYFPDGSHFSIPDRDPAPACLDIESTGKAGKVFLTLARPHWSSPQLEWSGSAETGKTSYIGQDVELPSIFEPELEMQTISIARLQTFLSVDEHHQDGHVRLQVCELLETADPHARIDPSFIEPCLCSLGNSNIRQILQAVTALLESKINQLRERRIRRGSHSSSEIGDFLLLQNCVQQRLLFAHLLQRRPLHPESAYRQMLHCLGAITLYGNDTAASFLPSYRHQDLRGTFAAIHAAIREALAALHDPYAIQIPLVKQHGGIHIGQIADGHLLSQARFYLTVSAHAPEEVIRKQFPTTVKIGPLEKLRDLVNLNLPGVRLQHLQAGQVALPYYADHLYFQLDTRNEALWKMLQPGGHLAIHYAGDLPQLRIELWAVRPEKEQLR